MNINEILDIIKSLAASQGFYGRLLESIQELDADQFEQLKDDLEAQNFSDVLDVVLFFET